MCIEMAGATTYHGAMGAGIQWTQAGQGTTMVDQLVGAGMIHRTEVKRVVGIKGEATTVVDCPGEAEMFRRTEMEQGEATKSQAAMVEDHLEEAGTIHQTEMDHLHGTIGMMTGTEAGGDKKSRDQPHRTREQTMRPTS